MIALLVPFDGWAGHVFTARRVSAAARARRIDGGAGEEARRVFDARDPAAQRREWLERDAGVGREVRIRVDGEVGDRVVVADEPGAIGEVALEHRERAAAPGQLVVELRLAPLGLAGEHPEARAAELRLELVLVE